MKISEISIQRPVFATVVNIVIVLLGLVAFERLTLREYPNIDLPVVSVETTWRGASAEIMESQVTKPLEDELAGIEGIDFISSTSRSESSQINVTFRINRDADSAAADVRDRVSRARANLPTEIDDPVVAKTEADALPIIYLALASDTVSALDVTDIANRTVQDRLQTLPGVASAQVFGAREYSMRIWLDPARMAALKITTTDIQNALSAQNIEVPGGRIEALDREFTVLTETDLKTPEQFANIILRQDGEYLVRISDVARVELGPADVRVNARHNGRQAVAVGIVKQSTANPLDVSKEVSKAIVDIQKLMPEGVKLSVAYDSTVFISASISSVYHTIAEAIGLVAVVIFLFLRSVRASIIPIITIPISLMGGLVVMYMLGFSLNTLTLLAFVLAIGLVVDDAIVMLENISRYVEQGMPARQAALKGSKEIGFAVIAMTLTLVAVYTPLALAEGRTGKLFSEFALALAGAVLVSGFIALTLSPMLSALLLKPGTGHAKEPAYVSRYHDMLVTALKRRKLVLGGAGFSMFLSFIIMYGVAGLPLGPIADRAEKAGGTLQGMKGAYVQGYLDQAPGFVQGIASWATQLATPLSGMPSELSPIEDRGYFVAIGFAPEGSTIDYTTRYTLMAEKIFRTIPEQHMFFTVAGVPVVSQMLAFVVMKDWGERDRSVEQIVGRVGGQLFGIPGFLSFGANPPSLGQDPQDTPVNFILQTTGSWEELNNALGQLMGKIAANPNIQNARPDLQMNKPELRVSVARDKVAAVNASVDDVGRTLQTMLGGLEITRFKKDGEQYDVIMQVEDAQRRDPSNLSDIFVRTSNGEMIQLANLVDVREAVAPRELNHFSKLRSATITATLSPGYTVGSALDYLDKAVAEINAPGISVDYGGVSREYKNSSSTIVFVFALAIVFIYLVLAAQFESFIDPLIILLAVPLAIFGALLALWLTGNTMNIYSQIGLVTLVGLIAKNGILIVEFANQLQEEGKQKYDAVVQAATMRLRPILMTTAATVGGAIPLAFATGAGAESRETIGWVIVGGMTIGTFFTLFVVPTFYIMMAQNKVGRGHAA